MKLNKTKKDNEVPETNHQSDVMNEAERLRWQHKDRSESLAWSEDTLSRAQELRNQISQSDSPENNFTYDERVFANGEVTQGAMLDSARRDYSANMWEAREHYRGHEQEYHDEAIRIAEGAGVELHTLENGEKLRERPSFDLVLARHAAYYDPRSEQAMKAEGVSEDEIRAKLGHLTGEGEEQAHDFGRSIVDQALAEGSDTDITFIASTQLYESPAYPDAPWSGRRAEETAAEAMAAMLEVIEQKQADGHVRPDQIRLATPRPEKVFGAGQRPNERLVEREVYFPVNQIGASMISRYRARTGQVMEDEDKAGIRVTGGYSVPSEGAASSFDNFDKREKEFWSRGEEDIDRFAAAMSAERSADVADRIMSVVDDMNELAALHEEREPNRKLIVVLISHDAVVGAVTHKGMGADTPVIPSYMDRVAISVNNGVASFEQNGKISERTLGQKH